jgi:hypothetical protein
VILPSEVKENLLIRLWNGPSIIPTLFLPFVVNLAATEGPQWEHEQKERSTKHTRVVGFARCPLIYWKSIASLMQRSEFNEQKDLDVVERTVPVSCCFVEWNSPHPFDYEPER